jgi:hypothetical protein
MRRAWYLRACRVEIDIYRWMFGVQWTPWITAGGELAIYIGPIVVGRILLRMPITRRKA